jgi:copper transport protein
VIAELGLGVAVLALTAALVVSIPSVQSYIRPFTQTLSAPGMRVAVRIDAPRTGDTALHLSVQDQTGKAVPLMAVRGSLSQPKAGLGPLPLRLPSASGETATGAEDIGLTFPRNGNWVLQLTVQISAFDSTSFTIPVDVS